jgi:hypothetical protein
MAKDRRLELDAIFRSIVPNVYYQPPSSQPPPSKSMIYPCIVYGPAKGITQFADNAPYRIANRYSATVIDLDPDSVVSDKVALLPTCILDRPYTFGNLNHWTFLLYY